MIHYDILLGCVVIFLVLYYYISTKYSYWKVRGVKGPTPVPILGNFGRILLGKTTLAAFLQEIYVKYSGEPLVGIYSGLDPILVVKDPEFIKDVLIKDFSNFAERGIYVNDKVCNYQINTDVLLAFKNSVEMIAKINMLYASTKSSILYSHLHRWVFILLRKNDYIQQKMCFVSNRSTYSIDVYF